MTSGGDCSGLNAILRSSLLRCIELGHELYGIPYGLHGVLEGMALTPLNDFVNDPQLIRTSGSMIGMVNKGVSLQDTEYVQRAINALKELNLDHYIIIGGDGSLRIFHELCKQSNIPFTAIPKTIDNDIFATELSVGFDSCIHVVTQALDQLHTTAASHDRLMILEVMGRDSGAIALHAGIAGGADFILIPEQNYSIETIVKKLNAIQKNGKKHALMIIAEGVKTITGEIPVNAITGRHGGIGDYLAKELAQHTDIEIRVNQLGHIQRGGTPTHNDRILGTMFGAKAIDIAVKSKESRLLVLKNHQIVDIAFTTDAIQTAAIRTDNQLLSIAKSIGIYITK